MMACKICGNDHNNIIHHVQEQMFGFGDEFEYLECSVCGCMQLLNIPADMQKYYPKDGYYSFRNDGGFNDSKYSLSNFLRRIKSEYLLFGKNKLVALPMMIGYIVPGYYKWLKKVNAGYDSSILDLGCGGGELLFRLRRIGFKQLTGADPFIQENIQTDGIRIYKTDVFGMTGSFDFIMVNHAFEHMESPLLVLKKLYELLKPKSYLMIRIPVTESYCRQHYGVYWSSWDAPRHLYIHSAKSMQMLCEQAGFEIKETEHDSGAFQFWASEQYKNGISMVAPNSYETNKRKSTFSRAQIRDYKKRMELLNRQQQGGDGVFYLYKD